MRDFPKTKKSDCMPMAADSFSITKISKWIRLRIQTTWQGRYASHAKRTKEIDLSRLFGELLEGFSGGLGIALWQSLSMMSDDKGLYPKLFMNLLNPLIGSHDRLRQWNGQCKQNDLHDGAILCPALQEE